MSRIICIVTIYYPQKQHIENIKRYVEQSDLVIVCDNSPMNNGVMLFNLPRLLYYPNYENQGLSKAFNIVLQKKELNWNDDDYIVFFDQDSIVEKDHILKLINEFNNLLATGVKVGCLGPVFFNNSNDQLEVPRMYKAINNRSMIVSSIMTSSMVCKYGMLKEIGFWNEEIFLDLADWDVCWRMQAAGKVCVMTHIAIMNHRLGEGERRLGPLRVGYGKPVREYYQTRDCQYLLRKEYTPIKYKVRFCATLTIRPLLHLLLLKDKKKRLYYIIRGIKDYRAGVHGELKEAKGK